MPRLPGADFSKISPSFWLTWRRALVILPDSNSLLSGSVFRISLNFLFPPSWWFPEFA